MSNTSFVYQGYVLLGIILDPRGNHTIRVSLLNRNRSSTTIHRFNSVERSLQVPWQVTSSIDAIIEIELSLKQKFEVESVVTVGSGSYSYAVSCRISDVVASTSDYPPLSLSNQCSLFRRSRPFWRTQIIHIRKWSEWSPSLSLSYEQFRSGYMK